MKISYCMHCGFKTKEKNHLCPMCHKPTKRIKEKININYHLPKMFPEQNRDVSLFYTCPKCQETMRGICFKCNRMGLLTISYHGKKAIVRQLNSLYDVYNEEEVNTILSQLSLDEKYLLYYQFSKTINNLAKRDNLKACVCIFVGFLMYLLSLQITLNYYAEYIVISYGSNAFGNAILTIFLLMGIFYLFDAVIVEKDFAKSIGIITGVVNFLYFIICLFCDISFKKAFYFGIIFIGISILLCVLYYFISKKR